jgi:hypothetical protein
VDPGEGLEFKFQNLKKKKRLEGRALYGSLERNREDGRQRSNRLIPKSQTRR